MMSEMSVTESVTRLLRVSHQSVDISVPTSDDIFLRVCFTQAMLNEPSLALGQLLLPDAILSLYYCVDVHMCSHYVWVLG